MFVERNMTGPGYDSPSADKGPRRTAQKAEYQYGHRGLIRAMSSGDAALMNDVMTTR